MRAWRIKPKVNPTVSKDKQGQPKQATESNPPVGLHVDPPLFRVQPVRLQRPRLAKALDLVHDLVTAVVASSRQALRILDTRRRTQGQRKDPVPCGQCMKGSAMRSAWCCTPHQSRSCAVLQQTIVYEITVRTKKTSHARTAGACVYVRYSRLR